MYYGNNNHYYTAQDDQTIIREIKKNLNNMDKAFYDAAHILSRTPAAVRQRWYNNLRSETSCFWIVDSDGKKSRVNTKNKKQEINNDLVSSTKSAYYKMNKKQKSEFIKSILPDYLNLF